MTVVLLANPRSGRGRAMKLRSSFDRDLRAAGYSTRSLDVPIGRPASTPEAIWAPDRFTGAEALVLFGGDGTVNAAADRAIATRTPVYHVPTGNENLFARAFGMNRCPGRLIETLRRPNPLNADIAICNGHRFLIMASVGPDAEVIRSMALARTRAIGHLAYAWPVARQLTRQRVARLTVKADGDTLVRDEPGMVVVANAREYALRIDPAPDASLVSGTLQVVFFPAKHAATLLAWYARSRVRVHQGAPGLIQATASEVYIRAADTPFQIDGEWPGDHDGEVRCSIEPGVLPVLSPGRGVSRPRRPPARRR